MGLDQARLEEMLSHTTEHAVPRNCLATNQDNRGDKYGTMGTGQARPTMKKDTGSLIRQARCGYELLGRIIVH